MKMPRPLVIDCDPGVDDAIALLLAFASPELELLGITTVAGNVPLALTQANARKICELARREAVPVYAGCPRPILQSLETAEHVHGKTGLLGVELPDPQMPLQSQHAVDFLIETLMAAPQPITIATLGPLTNVAIALIKEPRIVDQIQELVLMGGAIGQGNVTPSAEFNLFVDPHAAHVVFTSGIPLTMIGLDVTHQVLTNPTRLEAIRQLDTPISDIAVQLLSGYGLEELKQHGWDGSPLHDPCVIAYLIQPELFTVAAYSVEIETTSPQSMGRTVVDLWNATQRSANANVVQSVNVDGFYRLLTEKLANL